MRKSTTIIMRKGDEIITYSSWEQVQICNPELRAQSLRQKWSNRGNSESIKYKHYTFSKCVDNQPIKSGNK